MAALHDLDDDHTETRRELEQTRAHHTHLTHSIAALHRDNEPTDSPWLQKLGWQLDACRRWITRYEKELAA